MGHDYTRMGLFLNRKRKVKKKKKSDTPNSKLSKSIFNEKLGGLVKTMTFEGKKVH